MKHISIIAFAALTIAAAVSCQKEITFNEAAPATLGDMVFTATASYATKTELGENGLDIKWINTDSISIFRYYVAAATAGANNFFTVSSEGVKGDGSADFQGSVQDLSGSCTDAGAYYAASPYKEGAYLATGNKILVTIPEEAVGVAGGFPTVGGVSANPMIAKDNAGVLAFKNVAAVIKCNLTYSDVKSIKLTGNNDEVISGSFYAGFDGSGIASITDAVDGKKSATITAPAGVDTLACGVYYFLVKPQTFSKGVTFTMTTVFDNERVKTSSSSMTFKKATVSNVGDMIENTTVFPVVWPVGYYNGKETNNEKNHPEWIDSLKWYSAQPKRAQMEFCYDPTATIPTGKKIVPNFTKSTSSTCCSPSMKPNDKIYLYSNDALFFSVKLDNFSGKLKITIPLVNTAGPKFWTLSYSLDGTSYTTIDTQDFERVIKTVTYTTNATWACPQWNSTKADKQVQNVFEKEIPNDFSDFTGTLKIKFSAAPISTGDSAGQMIRTGGSDTVDIITARGNGVSTRFYFADARTFKTGNKYKNTPVSISVVDPE